MCISNTFSVDTCRFVLLFPVKKFFANDKKFIPRLGMYIPSFGMYVPSLGMYVPKFGIKLSPLRKNFYSTVQEQFRHCVSEM